MPTERRTRMNRPAPASAAPRGKTRPLFERVADTLREDILANRMPPDHKLPRTRVVDEAKGEIRRDWLEALQSETQSPA